MACSWLWGSATYLIMPSTELISPDTITPERTSITLDVLPSSFGISSVSATAARPQAKAIASVITGESPNRIASAAPTQAPEETPSRSGDTRGFRKIP